MQILSAEIGHHSPPAPFSANQLVSHTMEGTSLTNTNSISYWNASAFNNDQWSEITASAVSNSSAAIFACVRLSTSGQSTFYRFGWDNAALGSSGQILIGRDVNGTFSNIFIIPAITLNVGDTITAVVVGSNLLFYINDNLTYQFTDSMIASGAAGAETVPNTSLSSAAISAWSGGGFVAAPAPPNPFPPSSVYSVPDCRNYSIFPNTSVNVNGTLTYTVPSVDSRKAGAPVDSRITKPTASGTYPQNSRTPGTFGPGE